MKASIEQRDRETPERHRAQAVRVFMWEDRRDDDPVLDQQDVAVVRR